MSETIKLIIEYVSLIGAVIFIIINLNKLMLKYQQNHYHTDSLVYNYEYYLVKSNALQLLFIPIIIFCNIPYLQIGALLIFIALLILQKQKKVIGLVYTNRIIRLFLSCVITLTAIDTILLKLLPFKELLAVLLIDIIVLPVFFFLGAMLIWPLEYLISKCYQAKAKQKLKNVNPTVIAITGSYGKTTTKNILFECLKHKFLTYKTPKSYNTNNGIAKDVNASLNKVTEVAVLEYGASRVGDIDKLCKFVNPDIAIITAVGPQHLKTFNSLANIYQEKTRILDYVKTAYVNYEVYQNCNINSSAKIITFGKTNAADWYPINVKQSKDKLEFTITNHQIKIVAKTRLIGEHQINNIVASVAAAYDLGVSIAELELAIALLEPVEHRLETKKMGQFIVLDDSYNSNPVGFSSALDVLQQYDEQRILITPGIVEAGEASSEINRALALKIKDIVQEVVIIKCESGNGLKKALEDKDYQAIKVVDSFQEAMNYVQNKYDKGALLIENDVPDIYLM